MTECRPGYPAHPQGRVEPLVTAAEAYPTLERMVSRAERSIWLAYRVFEPWTVLASEDGQRLGSDWIALLRSKLEDGVQVRLMLSDFDPLGGTTLHERSWRCLRALSPLWEHGDFAALPVLHMAEAGWIWRLAFWPAAEISRARLVRHLAKIDPVERRQRISVLPGLWHGLAHDLDGRVRYRPAGPPRLYPATYHQKFAVIDGRQAMVGGLDVNRRRWDDLTHGRPADETWADAALAVEGPVASDLGCHFAECWAREAPRQLERVATLVRHAPRGLVLPPMPGAHHTPAPPHHDASVDESGDESNIRARRGRRAAAATPRPAPAIPALAAAGEREMPLHVPIPECQPVTIAAGGDRDGESAARGGTIRLIRTVTSTQKDGAILRLRPRRLISEIETAHIDLIATAERLIYVETQFLRARRVVDALIRAARRNPRLGLIVVLPLAPMEIAFEDKRRFVERLGEHLQGRAVRRLRRAFGARSLFIAPLRKVPHRPPESDTEDRAAAHGAEMIFVHTKVMTIDDSAAIVGSANANGRSMRWDVEVALRLDGGPAPAATRRRLFEHWLPDDAPDAAFATDTAPEEWRRIAFGEIARPPALRQSFLAPYPPARAWRFGRAVPGVPEDAL